MNMKLKNKKGFSIVEVVIAMLVISVVTATSLSIVYSSADNTKAAMYKADAQYLVADALECFKVSADETQFYNALSFRGGLAIPEQQEEPDPEADSKQKEGWMVESGYRVLIVADYEIDPDHNNPTLGIMVFDTDGQQVAELNYIKARR